MIVVPHLSESFSLTHELPDYTGFLRRLGEGRTLIRYDYRGCGLSQQGASDVSLERLVEDIHTIIGSLGLIRFSVLASAYSGMTAVRYAALVSSYRDCVQGPAFAALVSAGRSTMRRAASGGTGLSDVFGGEDIE